MPIRAGEMLLHYRLVEKIGEGGMGVVWNAVDTTLDRDVAIKFLPDAFAEDSERLARFEREAKLLALLNHPNIGHIYGLVEAEDTKALVLELIEGPTLAERIRRGPIPLDEALLIARQIAEGLEAAHEQDIIHRDLKPANIKVTPEGMVKLLDFGLAKALEPESPDLEVANSPTMTMPGAVTRVGIIMGTAAYMSPEQAAGNRVDKGSDLWAFGVVLWEILTGRQAFTGQTTSHVLASVLKTDPDWAALPKGLPGRLRRLLRRCLDRNATQRLRDIREARIVVEDLLRGEDVDGVDPSDATGPVALWPRLLPWSVASVGLLLAAWAFWGGAGRGTSNQSATSHFNLALPAGHEVHVRQFGMPMALAPDGSRLVYVASDDAGRSQLYQHVLDSFDPVPIPGTEGADVPFFSHDGAWVGFYQKGELKKVALTGGEPLKICDASSPNGAAWGGNGTIVFDAGLMGLFMVDADGGEPERLAAPDTTRGERQLGMPQFLPDGRTVLFSVWTDDGGRIGAVSTETGDRRILAEPRSAWRGQYVATGHLVYAQSHRIMAAPFDSTELVVTGSPVPVVENVFWNPGVEAAYFVVAREGSMVYLPAGPEPGGRELVWVDRRGQATPVTDERAAYVYPRISPDGRQVAVSIGEGLGPEVHLIDLARGTRDRLSTGNGGIYPVWALDGARVIFASQLSGPWRIHERGVEDVGPERLVIAGQYEQLPESWSPDGILVFQEVTATTGSDLWALHLTAEREPEVILNTRFKERAARFSPDGKWLAYVSDQSGRDEVWVQRFPSGEGRQIVSTNGGLEPVWARDGHELFYRESNRLMVVSLDVESERRPSAPRVLFEGRYEAEYFGNTANYDVSSDGRFLMIRSSETSRLVYFNVVENWFEELQAQVPTH